MDSAWVFLGGAFVGVDTLVRLVLVVSGETGTCEGSWCVATLVDSAWFVSTFVDIEAFVSSLVVSWSALALVGSDGVLTAVDAANLLALCVETLVDIDTLSESVLGVSGVTLAGV